MHPSQRGSLQQIKYSGWERTERERKKKRKIRMWMKPNKYKDNNYNNKDNNNNDKVTTAQEDNTTKDKPRQDNTRQHKASWRCQKEKNMLGPSALWEKKGETSRQGKAKTNAKAGKGKVQEKEKEIKAS
jgi:hypothetical protein